MEKTHYSNFGVVDRPTNNLDINLGFSKSDAKRNNDLLWLRVMIDAIRRYENSPTADKNLMDEKEYWYRQALMNITTKFSPWALQNNYKKSLPDWNSSPAIRSWTGAKQGDKSYGNDRPYTISEAQSLYSGGWVGYQDFYTKPETFGSKWKDVAPVILSVVGGALVGGPVGAVAGAVAGTTQYAKKGAAENAANKLIAQSAAQSAMQQSAVIEAEKQAAIIEDENSGLQAGFLSTSGNLTIMILMVVGVIILFVLFKPKI